MPPYERRLSKKNNCGSGFCGKIQSRPRESVVRSQASEAFGTGMSSSSRWGKPFGYRWCDARFRGLIRVIRCKPSSVSDLPYHHQLRSIASGFGDVFPHPSLQVNYSSHEDREQAHCSIAVEVDTDGSIRFLAEVPRSPCHEL